MAFNYHPSVDEPYMSTCQLAFFKQKLLSWRDKVLAENNQYTFQLLQEIPIVPDQLDQSVEAMNRNMALLNGQRSRIIIQQINAALKRLEDGSYGYCLSSGEEIGLRRLLAWPITTLSLEAQELHERRLRLHSS